MHGQSPPRGPYRNAIRDQRFSTKQALRVLIARITMIWARDLGDQAGSRLCLFLIGQLWKFVVGLDSTLFSHACSCMARLGVSAGRSPRQVEPPYFALDLRFVRNDHSLRRGRIDASTCLAVPLMTAPSRGSPLASVSENFIACSKVM